MDARPPALLLSNIGLMTPMFVAPDEPPNPALILPAWATGLLYFVALGLLVLQLVLPSRTLDDTARRRPAPASSVGAG